MSAAELLMEAGHYRYRCADGGHQAVSKRLIVDCLWHGSECIDWYLQVDPANAAALLAGVSSDRETRDG